MPEDRAGRLFEQAPRPGQLAEMFGTGWGARWWFGAGSWGLGWVRGAWLLRGKERHRVSATLVSAPAEGGLQAPTPFLRLKVSQINQTDKGLSAPPP